MSDESYDAQIEKDVAELGDAHLINWGRMIAAQGWPGPRLKIIQPMFREVLSGYREESEHDMQYDFDEANITDDIIHCSVTSDRQIGALHLYYVNLETRTSLALATEEFSKWTGKNIGIGKFREMILVIKVQVGAAHRYRQYSAVDLDLIREFARQKKVLSLRHDR